MSRQPAHIALVLAVTVAAACAPDATAPTAAPRPGPGPASPLLVSRYGYQASVLPLQSASAINSSGAVVGRLANGLGGYYAHGMTTVLALPSDGSADRVDPVDLLDDGRILARGYVEGWPWPRRALYYPSRTSGPVAIAVPSYPASTIHAFAMNGQGVVVGSYGARTVERAFRWSSSTGFMNITPAGQAMAEAFDIAETGQIVGRIGYSEGTTTPYRWDAGGATGMALPSGLAVQQALDGGNVLVTHTTFRSAIWSLTAIKPVGPDPTLYRVDRISPSGRLIGSFRDPATGDDRPWTSIGSEAATALPLPAGFRYAEALAVNACGTILGRGYRLSDGTQHAVLWSRSFTCDASNVVVSAASP